MKIRVNIEEVLSRVVEVEACSGDEAEAKVRQMYRNEDIVLDASDFAKVDFYESGTVV